MMINFVNFILQQFKHSLLEYFLSHLALIELPHKLSRLAFSVPPHSPNHPLFNYVYRQSVKYAKIVAVIHSKLTIRSHDSKLNKNYFVFNASIGKNSLNYTQNYRKIQKIDLMNLEPKSELCECSFLFVDDREIWF